MSEHHSVIIIGAGLSGLYSAWQLQQKQQDVILLEARNRAGGRIFSADYKNSRFDMGPAWVWPHLQPRLNQLMKNLDLDTFKQHTSGAMLYEKNPDEIEHYTGQSSHSESYRIAGASQQLIETLQNKLPESGIHLNTLVQSINKDDMSIYTIRDGKKFQYTANKIILALPPRLIQQNIDFTPAIPEEISNIWKSIPTWMSGHCKIMFIYEKPFWRDNNLSGEVFSHYGPLSEIYDGSPSSEEYYALTAFVGLNAHQRKQVDKERLIESCMKQLQRLFGDESQNTCDIQLKDWSLDENTTAEIDLTSPMQHPQYPEDAPRHFWGGKVILTGTEFAREHGGYLEGAIESADEAISNY
ncbi:MAG: amine oxidase [endosymbiont of Galathealinum brachiosum]|uniref:Amine oxidase n=1 Tax=endosymbiont of Galathealinum brachiosum TaxID=2200906 RepID=A0A370DME6_9GAMM|nr:MAG: amine oxidase [endosymbiont of Galathealinum brachiosum]